MRIRTHITIYAAHLRLLNFKFKWNKIKYYTVARSHWPRIKYWKNSTRQVPGWKHSVPGTEERTRTPNIVANDASRAKPNGCLVAEVPKGERKVRTLHDTCNRAWNVSSKNQGDLEIVKQEVGHLNVVAFSVSEANWTGNYEVFHSGNAKSHKWAVGKGWGSGLGRGLDFHAGRRSTLWWLGWGGGEQPGGNTPSQLFLLMQSARQPASPCERASLQSRRHVEQPPPQTLPQPTAQKAGAEGLGRIGWSSAQRQPSVPLREQWR